MEDLAYLIRTLSLLGRILEVGCGDLTMPQYRLLALVAEGDERATVIAEHLAVTKATVTGVVDGLVQRGLIERAAVAGDRRALRLNLTPAGKRALKAAERGMSARLQHIFERTPDPAAVEKAFEHLGVAVEAVALEQPRRARS